MCDIDIIYIYVIYMYIHIVFDLYIYIIYIYDTYIYIDMIYMIYSDIFPIVQNSETIFFGAVSRDARTTTWNMCGRCFVPRPGGILHRKMHETTGKP